VAGDKDDLVEIGHIPVGVDIRVHNVVARTPRCVAHGSSANVEVQWLGFGEEVAAEAEPMRRNPSSRRPVRYPPAPTDAPEPDSGTTN
jgi:hypothetical protein